MEIIETERLLLRPFEMGDLDDFFEYISDPAVTEFEPYKPMTRQEARENLKWRSTTDEMIAVVLKGQGKLIGNVYLGNRDFESKELGYVFNRRYWGRGFAKEACSAAIAACFAAGTHRIYAELDPRNLNSVHLIESLGFVKEAHFRKNVYFWKDESGAPLWKDTLVYAKLENL